MNIHEARILSAQIVQEGKKFTAKVRLRPCSEDAGGPFGTNEGISEAQSCFEALCTALNIKASDYICTTTGWTESRKFQETVVTITKGIFSKVMRARVRNRSQRDQALAEAMLAALKQLALCK